MMPAVRCPTGCLINPRSFSPPVFPQRLECPDPADCPVMPDLPRLPRSASEAGFVVRYWPWRSSARRSGTTSNRKILNTLCATPWSSRRSPKTPFGICFSALIAQGDFLELVVMDRPQGPAVIHAMPMRAKYRTLLRKGAMMSTTHGRTADGTPITDEMVEVIADEAERGYDVEQILRGRRGGRPSMGTAASSVESVRLDPELKRDLLLRAAEEHISVSEAIRRAISRYLHAS
jgi:hypothetical protein